MDHQEKFRKQIKTGWKFYFFLLSQLPLGWLVGLRIRELDHQKCITSVPFKWWTKNPFKSMYFAVQSMAAELSTAAHCLAAVQGHTPSIAFIIVDMKATFYKKATKRVYFTCNEGSKVYMTVAECVKSKESKSVTLKTTGKMKDGTIVADFEFSWSFKQRSQ